MTETMILLSLLSAPGPAVETSDTPIRFGHMFEHLEHCSDPPHDIVVEGQDKGRSLNRTVFGFLPYWVNYAWLEYDLISVLACFSVDIGSTGTITNYHGFPASFAQPIDSIHDAGGIAVITATNFSSSGIHSILTTFKTTAIATLVQLVVDNPVEGVCIDFENVSSADRDALTEFMQDLRDSLEEQSPGSHLSICTPAVDWNGSFNYIELASTTDALFMMCYPFHGSWSQYAGPCCPLTGWGSSPESPSNMVWCLGDYVIHAPEVHEKLIIGLPYYGHQWPTESGNPHSPVQGSCSTLFYTTLAGRAETYGRLWDEESLTPWYTFNNGSSWNQGWFDDPESLGLKYDLTCKADFQGIGIWALGYDGSRPELWDQLEESFTGEELTDSISDNLESSFSLAGPSAYWHNCTEGGEYYGYFYTYTIASGPDINWAEWNVILPSGSTSWSIDVFIPAGGSALAVYRVHHDGLVDTVVVDQGSAQGMWYTLGSWSGCTELTVVVGDSTGTTGDRLQVDAVRYVSETGITRGQPGVFPERISVSCNPSPTFTLTILSSPEEGILSVFDVSGRLLWSITTPAGEEFATGWPVVSSVPSGVYVVKYSSAGNDSFLKLILLR
jgi:spore germination protein YaaH